MILLVAMIGAIVLTFRQRSGVKRQSYFSQISRERSDGVELIDVQVIKELNLMIDIGLGSLSYFRSNNIYHWYSWYIFK